MNLSVILGSASPRRRELLGNLISSFKILPPEIDETPLAHEKPMDYVLRIVKEKSHAIEDDLTEPSSILLITADTLVTIDDKILGKPADLDEAVATLTSLQGRTHQVMTGLSLLLFDEDGKRSSLIECEITEVTFKSLSEKEILTYLNNIEFLDKAGSYAIQSDGKYIVESLEGSLSNVIGLPMGLLYRMIRTLGIEEELL